MCWQTAPKKYCFKLFSEMITLDGHKMKDLPNKNRNIRREIIRFGGQLHNEGWVWGQNSN